MDDNWYLRDVERSLTLLSFSAAYISDYKNGISKLVSKEKRSTLRSAKSTLRQQINSTIYYIKQSVENNDFENLIQYIKLTSTHISVVEALFLSEWPEETKRIKAQPESYSGLYKLALKSKNGSDSQGGLGTNRQADKEFLKLESQGKLAVLLIRFFAAKKLFSEAVDRRGFANIPSKLTLGDI